MTPGYLTTACTAVEKAHTLITNAFDTEDLVSRIKIYKEARAACDKLKAAVAANASATAAADVS